MNKGAYCLSKLSQRKADRNKTRENKDNCYPSLFSKQRLWTYHPVCSEPPLDEANEDIGGVVAVVRDAAQAGVDGDHH